MNDLSLDVSPVNNSDSDSCSHFWTLIATKSISWCHIFVQLITPYFEQNIFTQSHRVEPGRIGHLHTHFIRQSALDLMAVGELDQVANNYYMLKQGTLLFATVHKLTGLIIVLRLLVQGGWIGQREGFIKLPRGFIGQFFLFENIV